MPAVDMAACGRPASEVLAWSRTLFVPALRDAVASLPPAMGHIAGYHLGWWDRDGNPTDTDGGKSIRAALALVSSAAVGGRSADAVAAAVAVELVHNFSLLHDDVMDGDDVRRHRQTAWRVFGLADAVLAGDALLALAFDVLQGVGRSGGAPPIGVLCATIQALVDGQHADMAFESRTDVDLDDCVRMAERKTGALLSGACALGAMAGGGRPEQIDHLSRFGRHFGVAFQLVDDLCGIWGDPASTGKQAHSDLRNRKKSFPIVAALRSGTAAGDELAGWLGDEAVRPVGAMVRAARLVDEAGGRQWCQSQLEVQRVEAVRHLHSCRVNARACEELLALLLMVVAGRPAERAGRGLGGVETPVA